MTEKEIQKLKEHLRSLTDKFTKEEEILREELECRDMINSCLCYGTDFLNSHYSDRYIEELGEKRVKELLQEQEDDFAKATVKRNIHTDNEGVSYNTIIWADEKGEE